MEALHRRSIDGNGYLSICEVAYEQFERSSIQDLYQPHGLNSHSDQLHVTLLCCGWRDLDFVCAVSSLLATVAVG